MKKLTRLLLINWHYFQNTIIEFGSINFLTGKNSAGKSTIIDALQVVLMGETRSTAFNRAASKKSERTLRSYLVGSMGEDIENGNKSLREGKDFSTYIVAEFFDDYKSVYFCLGAVFDTFADGSDINKRFFELRSRIPECRFIEDKKTMDSRRMTKFFKEKYPNKFETKDTSEGYKKIVLSRLNIHDQKFFTMMKKAISFEPINDIEKFITENVCDIEDNIDITSMQENILYYKQQEITAQSFENRLVKLNEICSLYSEIEKLRSRHKIQQFLIDYGTYKDFVIRLDNAHFELDKNRERLSQLRDEYDKLQKHIERLEEERDKLVRDKEKYWSDNKGEWLESEKKRYINEIEEFEKSISSFILNTKTSSQRWMDKLSKCLSAVDDESVYTSTEQLRSYLKRTSSFCENDFELLSPEFFQKIRDEYFASKEKLEPILTHIKGYLADLQAQADDLKKQIKSLKQGVKPYPYKAEKLKKSISEGLRQKYKKEISVEFLADMIEITDEQWHNAVEGYLNTQRMNIIVPPQYFMDAYKIYKEARRADNIHEYGIVDLQKVYEYNSIPKENSLAKVAKSDDKYVQSYINFLLGRVICCYSDDKLRDYRTSVTRECMLYHNFAVKPLNQEAYNNPYIGRNSIEKQIETKTHQLQDISLLFEKSSQKANNIYPFVYDEWFLAKNYILTTVASVFGYYESKKQYRQKLDEIIQTLDKIDLFWIDEMDRKINDAKSQIQTAHYEKEKISNSVKEAELKIDDAVSKTIPLLQQDIDNIQRIIEENYPAEYQNTTGIPRYEKELAECKAPSSVANKYISPVKATASLIKEREEDLIKRRIAYNSEEQTSFKVSDVSDNDEYEKEYQKINDFELPKYKDRIKCAKNEAMQQFESDFLYRLRDNIKSAKDTISDLNNALKIAKFGNDTYQFKVEPNPAYSEYYDMIMSDMLDNGNVGLFSYSFTEKYQSVIDNLFAQIISSDDDTGKTAKNVDVFSKYKTYLTFDLLSIDSNGRTEKLSKSIFTKSGGETQTPFYISVLASFAQLYRVNDYTEYGNTARIVIFDEAFNKMDGERIAESVRLLKKFGLQSIICSPPEKVADIAPVSDKTLLVYKEAVAGAYNSTVIEWSKESGDM